MNLKIKFRESFRPFAPAVLVEHAPEYFDLAGDSPYMMLVAPLRSERRTAPCDWANRSDDLLCIVNQRRSDVPAVTHVDYSARVQTVSADDNPDFYRTIRAFYHRTGCPLVVNTSFNVRGEPIVAAPQDAYRCFLRTGMDLLVLEDCLIWKHEQPPSSGQGDWSIQYEAD